MGTIGDEIQSLSGRTKTTGDGRHEAGETVFDLFSQRQMQVYIDDSSNQQ
jgi:hypothetical protein